MQGPRVEYNPYKAYTRITVHSRRYGKTHAIDLIRRNWLSAKWKAQEMKLWERYILGLWPNEETPLMQVMKEMSPVPPLYIDPKFTMFDSSKSKFRPGSIIGIDFATKHKPKKEIKMSNKARIGVLEDEVSKLSAEVGILGSRLIPPREFHLVLIGGLRDQIEALCEFLSVEIQDQPSKVVAVKIKKP